MKTKEEIEKAILSLTLMSFATDSEKTKDGLSGSIVALEWILGRCPEFETSMEIAYNATADKMSASDYQFLVRLANGHK